MSRARGWVPAGELEIGDICRTATDGEIILTEKEFDETPVPVYNFEVEGGHTYFVGDSEEKSVLVHNTCPKCDDNGWIPLERPISHGVWPFWRYTDIELLSIPCPRCKFNVTDEISYFVTRTPVKKSVVRSDGTIKITLDRPDDEGRIYILYGHGDNKFPHEVTFEKSNYLVATFVCCHAGVSNSQIPKEHLAPGACMTTGTLAIQPNGKEPDSQRYWKKKSITEGIELGKQWMIQNENLNRVVIYTTDIGLRGVYRETAQWPFETAVEITRQK